MKLKNLLLFAFLLGSVWINAQIRAGVSGKTFDLASVSLTVEGFIITMDSQGAITDFYSPNQDGKIDYYDNDSFFDQYRSGKIKSIGNVKIDYYDDMDKNSEKYGKLKSIGNIRFEYWDNPVFNKEKFGKVKRIGSYGIDYWPSDIIDNSRYGKLKSIGDISIDYGVKDIIDDSKYQKLIKFGPVKLDYWDDKFIEKNKYGQLKSISGNNDKINVVRL
ncbi:hypothetical protein C1637_18790 [Chryseobacterium lactis]|uniref:WG repeat-containing protein n=1 Tax=Chryseobacterium lactis TaxID=1241981 RepID=A0A3G6RLR7_CHRLC|nr:hypothetical protein [Chryseobacterium lactis]AZA84829.1 hypothetical protein EG342_24300 [Chryseobacterium lactis]AZB05218.1 hypothetical protein EG341_15180 [Chryseobacterium lactis]PNW12200.1 hypothetical protein C1637_18790 [Chryseobacterium lactis]